MKGTCCPGSFYRLLKVNPNPLTVDWLGLIFVWIVFILFILILRFFYSSFSSMLHRTGNTSSNRSFSSAAVAITGASASGTFNFLRDKRGFLCFLAQKWRKKQNEEGKDHNPWISILGFVWNFGEKEKEFRDLIVIWLIL